MKKTEQLKNPWDVIKNTFIEWSDDNISLLAGALAFFIALSAVPILILLTSLAGYFIETQAAHAEIIRQMEIVFSPRMATVLTKLLNAIQGENTGLVSIMSGSVLLLLSIRGFNHLQTAMNVVWHVESKRSWIFSALRKKLFSLLTLIVLGIFIILVFTIDTGLSIIQSALVDYLNNFGALFFWSLISELFLLLLMTLFLTTLYKAMPETKVKWRDVWLGGLLTSSLFVLSKFGLTLYLNKAQIISLYGGAGSFVVFLIWIYFAASIFLLGAKFTYVYSRYRSRNPS